MQFETLLKQYMDRPIKESYDDVFNKPTSKYEDMSVVDIIRDMKIMKESEGDMTELVEYLKEQDEVIEELFGRLGGGLANVGRGALNAAKNAGRSIGANAKAAWQNTKDTYAAGAQAAEEKKKTKNIETQMVKARELLGKILSVYTNAISAGYIKQPEMQNWQKMISLSQIAKGFDAALNAQKQRAAQARSDASDIATQGLTA